MINIELSQTRPLWEGFQQASSVNMTVPKEIEEMIELSVLRCDKSYAIGVYAALGDKWGNTVKQNPVNKEELVVGTINALNKLYKTHGVDQASAHYAFREAAMETYGVSKWNQMPIEDIKFMAQTTQKMVESKIQFMSNSANWLIEILADFEPEFKLLGIAEKTPDENNITWRQVVEANSTDNTQIYKGIVSGLKGHRNAKAKDEDGSGNNPSKPSV